MSFKFEHNYDLFRRLLAEHVLMTHKWAVNGRIYITMLKHFGLDKHQIIEKWFPIANKSGRNYRFYTVDEKIGLLEQWWPFFVDGVNLGTEIPCRIFDPISQEVVEIKTLVDPNELPILQ